MFDRCLHSTYTLCLHTVLRLRDSGITTCTVCTFAQMETNIHPQQTQQIRIYSIREKVYLLECQYEPSTRPNAKSFFELQTKTKSKHPLVVDRSLDEAIYANFAVTSSYGSCAIFLFFISSYCLLCIWFL